MVKIATALAVTAGAVLAVTGVSAGAMAMQHAFDVDESPAQAIGVAGVSGTAPTTEAPRPTASTAESPSTEEPAAPPVQPVVAAPVPVADDPVTAPPAGDDTGDGADDGTHQAGDDGWHRDHECDDPEHVGAYDGDHWKDADHDGRERWGDGWGDGWDDAGRHHDDHEGRGR